MTSPTPEPSQATEAAPMFTTRWVPMVLPDAGGDWTPTPPPDEDHDGEWAIVAPEGRPSASNDPSVLVIDELDEDVARHVCRVHNAAARPEPPVEGPIGTSKRHAPTRNALFAAVEAYRRDHTNSDKRDAVFAAVRAHEAAIELVNRLCTRVDEQGVMCGEKRVFGSHHDPSRYGKDGHAFEYNPPPVEGALEGAARAFMEDLWTVDDWDSTFIEAMFIKHIAAARSGHDGLREALDAMRLADLRPTVYVCGPDAALPWACGLSWTDSEGRHQSRHGLGATPLDAVLAARALSPDSEA